MSQIITPGDLTRPRVVSFGELRRVLAPYLSVSPREATLELHDLWKLGAPAPNTRIGTPQEKRILFPNQFSKWWRGLARRRGWDVTPQEAYRGPANH